MKFSQRPMKEANIRVSFEFFPPSSTSMEEKLWGCIEDFHFYTMNRPRLVYAICHQLGLRPGQHIRIAA